MTDERQWTYAELTAAAEKEIRFFAMMAVPTQAAATLRCVRSACTFSGTA